MLRLSGNHWGGVTFWLRLLGTKCGKRIFWPGSGIDVVEHDLIEIGDDCVFGSRSMVMCGTASVNKRVTLMPGANVADRCCLLPGVTLGTNGCLGSGSLAPEDATFGSACVTVGSTGNGTMVLDEGVCPEVLSVCVYVVLSLCIASPSDRPSCLSPGLPYTHTLISHRVSLPLALTR